jgi:5'-nucleotidase
LPAAPKTAIKESVPVLKIILTNDDGIDAPGLDRLHRCLRGAGRLVTVAPRHPQSGIAHRVTTQMPLWVEEASADRYSVDGTPADCARIAIKQIAPDAAWLIAGINPGANLGSDVYNSGTVAAAREAAILGCRAIAISQYIAKDCRIDWEITGLHASAILRKIMAQDLPGAHFWNINLPHPLAAESEVAHQFCALDVNPHKYEFVVNGAEYSYRGSIHERPREFGTDVAVCFDEGKIAVTRLALATSDVPCK